MKCLYLLSLLQFKFVSEKPDLNSSKWYLMISKDDTHPNKDWLSQKVPNKLLITLMHDKVYPTMDR